MVCSFSFILFPFQWIIGFVCTRDLCVVFRVPHHKLVLFSGCSLSRSCSSPFSITSTKWHRPIPKSSSVCPCSHYCVIALVHVSFMCADFGTAFFVFSLCLGLCALTSSIVQCKCRWCSWAPRQRGSASSICSILTCMSCFVVLCCFLLSLLGSMVQTQCGEEPVFVPTVPNSALAYGTGSC